MRLSINEFSGMVPLVESSKLPVKNADEAINCRFDSGSLKAYGGLTDIADTIQSVTQTLFLYEEQYWFSWLSEVHAVESPINDDAYARVYFTGDSYPKMTSNTVATGSGTMPVVSYRMGVKQPSAPVISSYTNNDQNDEGQEDDITRFYVRTYVNEFGEESMPSLISGEATIKNPDATVNLSLGGVGTNDQNITHQRIYRTNGDAYQLVAEQPIAAAFYLDNKTDDELGIVLDTWLFAEPLADMQGLTSMANGILAGFSGSTICFSEAYLPHAWPLDYQQTTREDIVAIAAVGSSVVVATKGNPYLFSGVSPDAISGQKIEIAQACVSSRSMVDMGEYAIYASPDGLVAIGNSIAQVITEGLFNKKAWAEYEPETIRAAYYEQKYVAFYGDTKGFVFDPRTKDFIELDFTASAVMSDLKTDTLYLAQDDELKSFDESLTYMSYTWSKVVRLDQRSSPSCCFIDTPEPERIGITIEVDGVQILNYPNLAISGINQMPGTSPYFRLPAQRGYEYKFTVSGWGYIHKIAFGSSMAELQNA